MLHVLVASGLLAHGTHRAAKPRHHRLTAAAAPLAAAATDRPAAPQLGPTSEVLASRGATHTVGVSPTLPGVAEATITLPAPSVASTLSFDGVRDRWPAAGLY